MADVKFRLAELAEFLDPRPEAEASLRPFLRAANIPGAELANRTHELPSREETIRVVGPGTAEALLMLEGLGRKAEPVEGIYAETPQPVMRLWRPNPFLEELLPQLRRGRALDMGCGSGREAVALAAAGFELVACDVLPDALERGREMARRYLMSDTPGAEPPIEWMIRDLEREGPPPGHFDLVLSFRFLHRLLLERIHESLGPGGSLVVETFTTVHRERFGKPRSDAHVLQPRETERLAPGLTVLHASEGWHGGSHTGRLWATAG